MHIGDCFLAYFVDDRSARAHQVQRAWSEEEGRMGGDCQRECSVEVVHVQLAFQFGGVQVGVDRHWKDLGFGVTSGMFPGSQS